jgi:hypothetical protein
MSRQLTQPETEMRGGPDDLNTDGLDGTAEFFPRKFPRQPTQQELLARPFVSKPVSERCWCGRPIKDSTNRCLREHFPAGL